MESASLAQIANSIIRWDKLCMDMLHHQLVKPQVLDACWHRYRHIQKFRRTMGLEGLGGLPIQIPSKHPLVKEALRERRPKPSSVLCACCSLFLTQSNYLQRHLRSWSCTGLLRFCLTFELYILELASTCIAFRQEKVLACSGWSLPDENGTNLI